MRIVILITTYNRPESLLNLLQDIEKFSSNLTIHLLIYNDCSTKRYNKVISYLKENFSFDYFVSERNGGKNNYYRLVNCAYQELEGFNFDYFIQLPDDVRLTDDFINKSILTFDNIKDRKKACLNLLNDFSRFAKQVWTNVKTENIQYNNIAYHKSGWVDMCFICTRKFFEIIKFSVARPEPIYLTNRRLSSGVGSRLSKEIITSGSTIYQVVKSLVIHNDHASVMHPDHRKDNPLISNHETVIVSLATMQGRQDSLKETIKSIINQVDEIWIYCNYNDQGTRQIKNPKIKFFMMPFGDLGDAGKFYNCHTIKGYHFTIDDDIIYPPDYVKTMVHAIERHKKKYLVTVHGRKFVTKPVKSYYHNDAITVSCLKHGHDTIVDVPGTGVMAYHTDTIQFKLEDFEASNMADIWAGKKAKQNKVPILAITHAAGWIKETHKTIMADSIYAHCNRDDSLQTEVVNSFI